MSADAAGADVDDQPHQDGSAAAEPDEAEPEP